MKIEKTNIEGAFIIYTDIYFDERGYFTETFNQKKFDEIVPGIRFVQDNQSQSSKYVLRGLHFQKEPHAQSKLVRCIEGKVLDVAVDLRKDSSSYGKWVSVELEENTGKQFFIPKGCAHGFLVLSDIATFQYKVDDYWHPECEDGINAFSRSLNIDWKIDNKDTIIMNEKDINRKEFEYE